MTLPSDEEIRALHEKYAPTAAAFELVQTHCRIVCEIAEQLIVTNDLAVDVELVRAGSLLHDIGVYRLYDVGGELDPTDYIRHGILGEEVLRDLGLPDALGRFCSHHTGVGLTRDDIQRQRLPLPPGDFLPESVEEELVLYADKFHSKRGAGVFVSADTYATSVRRFGPDNVRRFAALRQRYGVPDLGALAQATGHALS
ncbi:HD domain-containing protein [Kribbella sancticallisti]|uniref:HD domain-containing protein n=1 Tax=Kribbella sancticallisti TaxID=460087 RepID=A0ABN2E5A3_9ACTN